MALAYSNARIETSEKSVGTSMCSNVTLTGLIVDITTSFLCKFSESGSNWAVTEITLEVFARKRPYPAFYRWAI